MSNTAYREAGVENGEPIAMDPAQEQEMNQIKDDKLDLLGSSLAATRTKWISARTASGVERRWMEDLDQYLGRDEATKHASTMMEVAANGGAPTSGLQKNQVQRSTVYVNITRPKTNAVEARLANMLYPVDDLAWGIRPTASPALVMQALQEAEELTQSWHQPSPDAAPAPEGGAPAAGEMPGGMSPMAQPTPAQVPGVPGGMQPAAGGMPSAPAPGPQGPSLGQPFVKTKTQAALDIAFRKAKAMQDEILDALTECDFVAEARKMLHDVAVLGTGIMKGPIVVNRLAKAWEKVDGTGQYMLKTVEETRPASECVSPWNIYPDPTCGDNVHNGKGIWEKKNLNGKMLRDLVGQPGYLEKQIEKVLEQGPRRSTNLNERDIRDKEANGNEPMYECWEYWGDFEVEDLRACGVDVKDGATKVLSGCIIMVNDIVIKGFVNPLECGSMPYDFMVLEKADNSPWGYGVPFLCRPAQRVLNAAWRQMMDNAGLSVGPNFVVKPNIVQPVDGNWQITGRKIWNCMDDSVDVREAIHMFTIPNNSEEFEKIINMAMMFADEEASVPKIVQGDAQGNSSVGVTTIQMNSANVVLGRLVKQYDDMITKRHIRRYYDFFMAYSDNDDIKGDYQVEARGSTVLLVRDQQMQALMQFGQFQNSQIGPMVHWHKWVKEVMKAQHLDPHDLLKSDAEIEQILKQPPPPPPEQVKSETAVQVAQIRAEAQVQSSAAREEGELAFANAQAQMARDNHIAKLKELEMKRDLAMLQYANTQQITLEKVKAQLAQTAMVEETKRQVAAAKMEMDNLQTGREKLNTATQPTAE